ncbi:uncharacterized protein LOC144164164 [Haemaphysalis longicornis]
MATKKTFPVSIFSKLSSSRSSEVDRSYKKTNATDPRFVRPELPPILTKPLRSSKMGSLYLCAFLLSFVVIVTAKDNKPSDVPAGVDEWYRATEALPSVVAISTSSNSTNFKCLRAQRTSFDAAAKTTSYVWHMKHHGSGPKKLVIDAEFGNATHPTTYYVDNDRTRPLHAQMIYSDYQNCLVAKIPTPEHEHCALWVTRSLAHRVPQDCLKHYEEACHVRVPVFDRDLCTEEE